MKYYVQFQEFGANIGRPMDHPSEADFEADDGGDPERWRLRKYSSFAGPAQLAELFRQGEIPFVYILGSGFLRHQYCRRKRR